MLKIKPQFSKKTFDEFEKVNTSSITLDKLKELLLNPKFNSLHPVLIKRLSEYNFQKLTSLFKQYLLESKFKDINKTFLLLFLVENKFNEELFLVKNNFQAKVIPAKLKLFFEQPWFKDIKKNLKEYFFNYSPNMYQVSKELLWLFFLNFYPRNFSKIAKNQEVISFLIYKTFQAFDLPVPYEKLSQTFNISLKQLQQIILKYKEIDFNDK